MLKYIIILCLVFLFSSGKRIPSEYPGRGCILLTFNGYKCQEANNGQNSYAPSNLLQYERIAMQSQLAQYFDLWDVVITTDDSLYYTFSKELRIRCIITSDTVSYYNTLAGGLSDDSTLAEGDTTAVLVSVPNLSHGRSLADAAAHEIGHMLGLEHFPDWVIEGKLYWNEYDHGNAEVGPIMGSPYYSKHAQWSIGFNREGQFQNDTLIISKTFRRLYNK